MNDIIRFEYLHDCLCTPTVWYFIKFYFSILNSFIWLSLFIFLLLFFTGNLQSGAKLEILIVCRFAKLSVDEQRIARTASIIGTSFSADVLNNILPKQLRAYLPTILDSLVHSHWLNISSEQRAEGIRVESSFSHPLLHRTLYDLTPSSVKCKIHLLIAKVCIADNS